MFATPTLAARIDRAEGRLVAALAHAVSERHPDEAPFAAEIGGGVAVFAGAGSPSNKMIGVGFDGVPDEAELEAIEQRFAVVGAALQAEVSILAAPALHALLVRRGYEPRGFENVLGRPLGLPIPPLAPHVVVDVARLGDDMVGGASLRVDAGIAQLCGASTLPQWRRRGVQTSLLRARLADAARQGCDISVVTTQPASRSQENVQREGFSLLYVRQLLVKTP